MNLAAFSAVLLLFVLKVTLSHGQSFLGTCICNTTDNINFERLDAGCKEIQSCNVTERRTSPQRTFSACLIQLTRNPSDLISEPLIVQSCIRSNFDNSLFCVPANEQEVDAGVITTFHNDILRICCFDDNCNTRTLLESILRSRPDLQHLLDLLFTTQPPASNTPTISSQHPPTAPPLYAVITIPILSVIVVLALVVIVTGLCFHYRQRFPIERMVKVECTSPGVTAHSIVYPESSQDDTENSGSGSGKPLLVHRSIAGQINLHELIGKGRYGRVYKASYRLDDVAVKVFHTVEKASWAHEVDIYQTCLFCHPNILRFVASDSKDCGSQVELWLITEYCEFGSLYDVLSQRTFDPELTMRMAYTAVSGLDHLHTEIFGHEAKPAIVHRDLKSRNILVKKDFTCCIGDLGLALRYDRKKEQAEDPPSKKVGTKRYLAPEIIDDSISLKQFELFKRADIYSFGLILWEITMRGEIDDVAEEYLMPYQNMVPTDPSFEDMKKVVVVEKKRPPLPNRWNQSEVFRNMSKLIQQCWLHDSDARPTSQRLKRNMNNLQQAYLTDKKDGEHSTGK